MRQMKKIDNKLFTMNMYLWRLSKFPSLFLHIILRNSTLSLMSKSNDVRIRSLAGVIKRSFKNNIGGKEKALLDEIEKVRSFWVQSKEEIQVFFKPGKELESVSNLAKISSRSKFWSSFLFYLIREFQPEICLELGTCIGISASYQASALKLNNKGKLFTLEGSPSRAEIASQNLESLQLNNVEVIIGSFEDNLEKTLKRLEKIDYIFIDGNHNYNSTIDYFGKILPYLNENAIVIFDDINYSLEMNNAWRKILKYKQVSASVDLYGFGIVFINKNFNDSKHYSIGVLKY